MITRDVLMDLRTTSGLVLTAPSASRKAASMCGKMFAKLPFVLLFVFVFPNKCLLHSEKRTKEDLGELLQCHLLTLEHWGAPSWAWTELVEGCRRSHCCWEKEVTGQGGRGLGEPRSGVLEREWQALVHGQTWAL